MTIFRFSLMALVVTTGVASLGAARAGDGVALPSGRMASLLEAIWEPQTKPMETWLRLRFVVPGIGPELDFAEVGADLLALCQTQALPELARTGKSADQAIISISSEPLLFGAINPDVTQYFEAYRLRGGDCILEGF